MTWLFKSRTLPLHRVYPANFGRRLLKLFDDVKDDPRQDLRQKRPLDPSKTDLQIFRGLSDDDLWVDAGLPEVFLYLYGAYKNQVPDGWELAMMEMEAKMQGMVASLEV